MQFSLYTIPAKTILETIKRKFSSFYAQLFISYLDNSLYLIDIKKNPPLFKVEDFIIYSNGLIRLEITLQSLVLLLVLSYSVRNRYLGLTP